MANCRKQKTNKQKRKTIFPTQITNKKDLRYDQNVLSQYHLCHIYVPSSTVSIKINSLNKCYTPSQQYTDVYILLRIHFIVHLHT